MGKCINNHECWKLVFSMSAELHAFLEHHEQVNVQNITLAQAKVIGIVYRYAPESVPQKQLVKLLNLTPGAVSQTVDALVRENVLMRDSLPEDRRAVVLRLTPHGESLRQRHNQTLNALMGNLLSDVDEGEQKKFVSLLNKLTDSLIQINEAEEIKG